MRGTTPELLTLSGPGYKIQPRGHGMDFERAAQTGPPAMQPARSPLLD